MSKEHFYRQWEDPTAKTAINLAEKRGQKDQFPIKSSFDLKQKMLSPQVQAEREIHTYKMQLAQGIINKAIYRAKVTFSRSLLKQERRKI